MDSENNDLNMVIDDPQEIPCDEIICNQGYEAVEKPEGCQCIKTRPQRIGWGGPPRHNIVRPNLNRRVTTQRPQNLRLIDQMAKKYLIWLHDFRSRRQNFEDKVMGRI